MCFHQAKFGGHRHCGREDIIFLLCHVISQDYVPLHRWVPLMISYHLAKFRGLKHCGSGDKCFC